MLVDKATCLLKVEVTNLVDNHVVVAAQLWIHLVHQAGVDIRRLELRKFPILLVESEIRVHNLVYLITIEESWSCINQLTQAIPILTTADSLDKFTLYACLLRDVVCQRVSTILRQHLVMLLCSLGRCPTLDGDRGDGEVLIVVHLRDRLDDTRKLHGIVFVILQDFVAVYPEVDISCM